MRKFLPLLFIVCIGTFSFAQNNNNRLLNQPVSPRSCKIQVEANLFIATTYIELEFYNANNVEIEGLYYFSLNPGQAITAFQLDLHGKFRDGTIEDRGKASGAYNAVVGKRIDPALVQMFSANNFILNIYPIAPLSSRRVSMTVQQVLKKEMDLLHYFLPLKSISPIADFTATIKVYNSSREPFIGKGLMKGESFVLNNNLHEVSWRAKEILVENGLSFSIPLSSQSPIICAKNVEGRTLFAYRGQFPVQKKYSVRPAKLAVYWDNSINGNKRNNLKEIEFLREYLRVQPVSELEIICFNQQINEVRSFDLQDTSGPDWAKFLLGLNYQGASQYGELDFSKQNADQIFICTSGWNNYGFELPKPGVQPVYCINTFSYPDRNHLQKIVGKSGGAVIDLNYIKVPDAARQAGEAENFLLYVKSRSGKIISENDWAVLGDEEIVLLGLMPAGETELILDYGRGEQRIAKEVLLIRENNSCGGPGIERLQTLSMYDTCIRSYDWEWMRQFGLSESIVTLSTAFIVLERLEDYLRYNIKLPKDLEEECGNDILVKQKLEKQQKIRERTEREILANVARSYNQRIGWLDNKQKLITISDKEEQKTEAITMPPRAGGLQGRTAGLVVRDENAFNTNSTLSEVVVTAMGQARQPKELGYSVQRIRAQELTQARSVNLQNGLTGKVSGLNVQTTNSGVFADTRITIRGIRSLTGNNEPMLILDGSPLPLRLVNSINPNDILDVTILKSAAATAIYGPDGSNGAIMVATKKGKRLNTYYTGVYKLKDCEEMDYIIEISKLSSGEKYPAFKRLENLYGHFAAFYFDMAQHFYESGLRKEAIEILYSAAGKGNGDKASVRAFAYTLEYWKMFTEAITVYQHILRADSSDLYAWRDLALAHYQANQPQEAVNMLYKAIRRNWNEQEATITNWKAILLQEMNAIINTNRQNLDLSGIDEAIMLPIPVDLRITVQCNRENGGSIAILTPRRQDLKALKESSGRIPNDFQVKQAIKGKYTIRANYWYTNSGNAPTFYKIVSFKNFGSPGQTIEIENVIMDNQSGLVDIGEVRWR